MANYAVVNPEGGFVSNVVVGESKTDVEAVVGSVVEVTEETGPASINWYWDGTVFSVEPPVVPEEPVV